jgi:chromosome segregation ATPase
VFKRLRERLEAALAAATPPPDLHEMAGQMREAVIEARAGVQAMREALEQAEHQLSGERSQLETAERRRSLAADINDAETVAVAERFAARHQERVAVLERKVAAQREELALAERDLGEMQAQLEELAKRRGSLESERSREAAWSGLAAAGGQRPETDLEQELLRSRMDRAAREAAADAKLEELKKRMGRS